MCWLLDFTGYTLANAPPLKVSIHCNNILQNHYPERLGMAVCYHAPYLFSLTWKVCVWGGGRAVGLREFSRRLESISPDACSRGEVPQWAFWLARDEWGLILSSTSNQKQGSP